jgi:hypothetical protein
VKLLEYSRVEASGVVDIILHTTMDEALFPFEAFRQPFRVCDRASRRLALFHWIFSDIPWVFSMSVSVLTPCISISCMSR